jgi:hypothetical protein
MKLFTLLSLLFSFNAFSLPCDCLVQVFGPLTGPKSLAVKTMKIFELEEFSKHSNVNGELCRKSCMNKFEKEITNNVLNFELLSYSQELIQNNIIGHNCTGSTTLKFPIRVKARLGGIGLGNVSDFIQVINFEEPCFN